MKYNCGQPWTSSNVLVSVCTWTRKCKLTEVILMFSFYFCFNSFVVFWVIFVEQVYIYNFYWFICALMLVMTWQFRRLKLMHLKFGMVGTEDRSVDVCSGHKHKLFSEAVKESLHSLMQARPLHCILSAFTWERR